MHTIKLEALNFEVKVPDRFIYHDKRAVFRYTNDTRNIKKALNGEDTLEYRQIGKCTTRADSSGNQIISISYITLLSPKMRSFTKGHEETHALQRMGVIRALEKALEHSGINTKTLNELDDEVVADIGGRYALFINGFVNSLFYALTFDDNGSDELARYWLLKNKKKRSTAILAPSPTTQKSFMDF
jgi:hypothetical protein